MREEGDKGGPRMQAGWQRHVQVHAPPVFEDG